MNEIEIPADQWRDFSRAFSVQHRDWSSHLAHRICRPERLWFEETEDGSHAGLRVAAADQVTRVRFRAAARPEELDGLP